jgi:small nuclear ribonucleoprotein (snRNP)-like protein
MYNAIDLLGSVVTLKTIKGDEIIAKLIGFDEDTNTLTLEYPKIVVVAGDTVALAPFALTAKANMIITESKQFLAIMESLESTVVDYNDLIAEQRKLEEADVEVEVIKEA